MYFEKKNHTNLYKKQSTNKNKNYIYKKVRTKIKLHTKVFLICEFASNKTVATHSMENKYSIERKTWILYALEMMFPLAETESQPL